MILVLDLIVVDQNRYITLFILQTSDMRLNHRAQIVPDFSVVNPSCLVLWQIIKLLPLIPDLLRAVKYFAEIISRTIFNFKSIQLNSLIFRVTQPGTVNGFFFIYFSRDPVHI